MRPLLTSSKLFSILQVFWEPQQMSVRTCFLILPYYFSYTTILFAKRPPVKLITSFLLSYPLAGLLKRVPDERPALKNLFIFR